MATKSIGTGGDYTTIAAYVAYLQGIGDASGEIGELLDQQHSAAVAVSGFTTNSGVLTLRAASGASHDGRSRDVTGTGAQILSSGGSFRFGTGIGCTFENLDLKGSSADAVGLAFASSGKPFVFTNCIIHSSKNAGLNNIAGIALTVRNTILYRNARAIEARGTAATIENVTAYSNGDWGILGDSTTTARNNYSGGHSSGDYWAGNGAWAVMSKCASADTTGSEAGLRSLAAANQFVDLDAGQEDFSLVETSALIDAGVAATLATDIVGTDRPQGDAWDIGASEYIVVSGNDVVITSTLQVITSNFNIDNIVSSAVSSSLQNINSSFNIDNIVNSSFSSSLQNINSHFAINGTVNTSFSSSLQNISSSFNVDNIVNNSFSTSLQGVSSNFNIDVISVIQLSSSLRAVESLFNLDLNNRVEVIASIPFLPSSFNLNNVDTIILSTSLQPIVGDFSSSSLIDIDFAATLASLTSSFNTVGLSEIAVNTSLQNVVSSFSINGTNNVDFSITLAPISSNVGINVLVETTISSSLQPVSSNIVINNPVTQVNQYIRYTEELDNTEHWEQFKVTVTTNADGVAELLATSELEYGSLSQSMTNVSMNSIKTVSFEAKPNSGTDILTIILYHTIHDYLSVDIDIVNHQISWNNLGLSYILESFDFVPTSNGFYRFYFSFETEEFPQPGTLYISFRTDSNGILLTKVNITDGPLSDYVYSSDSEIIITGVLSPISSNFSIYQASNLIITGILNPISSSFGLYHINNIGFETSLQSVYSRFIVRIPNSIKFQSITNWF